MSNNTEEVNQNGKKKREGTLGQVKKSESGVYKVPYSVKYNRIIILLIKLE